MKKKENVVERPSLTQFNFWKDNKTDQHFTLTKEELSAKFTNWKAFQLANEERGLSWWTYYYGSQLMRCFITDSEIKQGLQSVFEEKEFADMYEVVRPLLDPNK